MSNATSSRDLGPPQYGDSSAQLNTWYAPGAMRAPRRSQLEAMSTSKSSNPKPTGWQRCRQAVSTGKLPQRQVEEMKRTTLGRAGSTLGFSQDPELPLRSKGQLKGGELSWTRVNAFFSALAPERPVLEQTTGPPSVRELEKQRNLFSTAQVPWLGRNKAPRDDDLEMLVKVLVHALQKTHRDEPSHAFKMLHNPHREQHNFCRADLMDAKEAVAAAETRLRRRVLSALERYPLCNVGELVSCDPFTWTRISDCLGGLNHSFAVRSAQLLLTSNQVRTVDRAVYHAAACPRQRPVDRGRVLYL